MRRRGLLRPLAEPDTAEHDDDAEDLDRAQLLAEHPPPQDHSSRRAEEAERRNYRWLKPREAAKPEDIGECCADQPEIGKAQDIGAGQMRKRRLEQESERQQQCASGRQLPRREGQRRNIRPPAAAEHGSTSHREGASDASGNTDGIERCLRREDQQGDTADTRNGGDDRKAADRRAEQQSRQHDDDQRLDRADRGRHASRQPIGRNEQQPPEDGEVQRAENERLEPPDPMRKPPYDEEQQQPGRQSAQGCDGQRIAGGQELRRHQIGAAPDRRRDGCQQKVDITVHGPGPKFISTSR